jgi:hypothetical protein
MLKIIRYILKAKLSCSYKWHRIFCGKKALPGDALAPIPKSELAFILGAPRSGTTLMVRLLNNSKDIH